MAFIVNGRILANDTPENLILSHGMRSLDVTLSGPKDASQPKHTILKMDALSDQQRLIKLMTHGIVRSVHSQEASLEEVFIEIAGFGLRIE